MDYPGKLLCGDADVLDTKSERISKAEPYIDSMNAVGMETETKEYENAVHSFIESNNPEGMTGGSEDMFNVINAEQEALARQAEAGIYDWIGASRD